MKKITLDDLLQNGVHFGHQRQRWNPGMKPYIFGLRNGIYIIHLEKTREHLEKAITALKKVVQGGGTVLFVGTKRQAKAIVKEQALRSGMPYIIERWPGGMFTNFVSIGKTFKRYNTLKADKESGHLDKYTKKERLLIDREIDRLEKMIGGVAHVKRLPDIIFIVDSKHEQTAVREAKKKGVPIMAMVDTNANPGIIDYPIPANDDATRSIAFIVTTLADAIIEAKQEAQKMSLEKQTNV